VSAPLSPTAHVILAVLADRQRFGMGAITIGDLAAGLGPAVVRRDVERALGELADAHYPVVARTSRPDLGVRLTDDPAEVRACARAYLRRCAQIRRRARALLETAAAMEQAGTLWSARDVA